MQGKLSCLCLLVVFSSCLTWSRASGQSGSSNNGGTTIADLAGNYSFDSLIQTSYGYQWVGFMDPASPGFGHPRAIGEVKLDVLLLSPTMAHLRLKAGPGLWAQPKAVPEAVFPGLEDVPTQIPAQTNLMCAVESPDPTRPWLASFVVRDRQSNEKLFQLDSDSSSEHGFTFADQYLEFTLPFPSDAFLSGFGEHNYYYFLNHDQRSGISPMTNLSAWNTDLPVIWKRTLYGFHPILYINVPSSPLFYAFVLVNSHAQQISITTEGGVNKVRFTAVGGFLDAYLISGSSPAEVVAQYYKLVGPAHVPPYWSLGTHQSRWGYENISVLEGVVAGYANASLPLEVLWTDINVMDRYRVFTTDPKNFPQAQLKSFIQSLHNNGQKYIQIVDPGIAYDPKGNYSVFNSGLELGMFMNFTNSTSGQSQLLVNYVWPGQTVFPDFTSKRVRDWWGAQLASYRVETPIDGVWLDMNEISAFCNGACSPINTPDDIFSDPEAHHRVPGAQVWASMIADCAVCSIQESSYNYPTPGAHVLGEGTPLAWRTIDMTAQTELGLYYSTKPFYGMMECQAAFDSMLQQTQKRPFLLSRSTFMGSGRITAHWTGDDWCLWEPKTGGIHDTIQGILAANLFGIPMVGSDIGGFTGAASPELVVRWTQLGAYYPFMRNHHSDYGPRQEPYLYSASATRAIRRAMTRRYHLLPYLFTALLQASVEGAPVVRHLSMAFPFESATYHESTNFMFGPNILVLPLVVEGQSSIQDAYVPAGPWVDLWTGYPLSLGQRRFSSGQSAPATEYSDVPVLLRTGAVVPIHTRPQMTVNATRASGISLIAALDPLTKLAVGTLLLDDGEDSMIPSDGSTIGRVQYFVQGDAIHGVLTATPTLATPSQRRFDPSSVDSSNNDTIPYVRIYIPNYWGTGLPSGFLSSGLGVLSAQLVSDFYVSVNGVALVRERDFTISNCSQPFNGVSSSSSTLSDNLQNMELKVRLSVGLSSGEEFSVFDATTSFKIEWYLNASMAPIPSNQTTAPSPPAPAPTSEANKDYRALVVVVVILCIVLAVALIYAAMMIRRAKRAEAENDFTGFLN